MTWQGAVEFVARVLIVYYFFKAGISNARKPKIITSMIQRKNIPLPQLVYYGVVLLQLMGSVMIVIKFYAWLAALGLILFTVLSNALFCTYWKMEGSDQRNIRFLFDANVSIIGGLILVILLDFI